MSMIRKRTILYLFLILTQVVGFNYQIGFARSSALPQAQDTPTISAPGAAGTVDVAFQRLGKQLIEMRAPRDIEEIELGLPYRWQITGTANDNYLQLNYNLKIEGVDERVQVVTVALDLYVNDKLIKSLTLDKGENQTIRVALPPEAFNSLPGNKHIVRLAMSADYPCGEISELRLFVNPDSLFHLQYDTLPPDLDLASLPRPLFQELLTREKAIILMPDDYSDADLTIAASVAATVGQKTFSSADVELISASQATPEKLANASAIIIGRPDQNSFLADLYKRDLLPTTLIKTRTIVDPKGNEIALNKGVVQLVKSEHNPNYVYLIVTGGNDEGVALAARAISATRAALRLGFNTDWAVVEQFAEVEPDQTENTDIFSFNQLGFRGVTLYGLGSQLANMQFFAPSSWRLTGDPVLNIPYVASSALLPGESGLTILLNNQPIGTVALNGTSSGTQEMTIRLPQDEIRLGEQNRLRFEVTMEVNEPCISPDTRVAWTRIRSDGYLKLSHTEVTSSTTIVPIDNPVTPLVSRADLSDVWFALPQTPLPEELTGLVRVASLLGRISGGPGFLPHISRGEVSQELLKDYNVVMIGQPMRNPAISIINDQLPQSFIQGENSLRQRVGNTEFRLTEDFSVGVLQTIHSPWNPQKYITVISGSTLDGISWVIDALLDDELYYTLNGNLAYIRGRQVEALSLDHLAPDVTVLTAAPTAIAQLVISSNVPLSTTSDVAFAVVPTPIEPTPVLGPLPDRFKPTDHQIPYPMQMAVWGLLAIGALAIGVGIVTSTRRTQS